VVVTNQAGVARGFFEEDFVRAFHQQLGERFAAGGARIDGWYYCPHHPQAPRAEYRACCECRKPAPGMLRRAERDLGLDLARSFVVGDRWLDVELGMRVGGRGILVRTGYGASEVGRPKPHVSPAAIVDNLIEAVGWILRSNHTGPGA
jgi:D-glycero-D-manno-heptose 1,7-bisphosphate phosphatase